MVEDALKLRTQLPRPDVTPEDAARILSEHFGLSGTLTELGSQQDRNYRIDTGEPLFVLKICRAAYDQLELQAQNAALLHLARQTGSVRVPQVMRALDGNDIVDVTVRGEDYRGRLLTYLDGVP